MELLFQGWSKCFKIFGPGGTFFRGSIFYMTHVSFKCVTEYNRDICTLDYIAYGCVRTPMN